MAKELTYALSIAGHDPSGGAGTLADAKVFEHHDILGFGIVTSITYQNERTFEGVSWLASDQVTKQLKPLSEYPVKAAKIGLIKDLAMLDEVIGQLKSIFSDIKIIWDPILKASAGFDFHTKLDRKRLEGIYKKIYLVTPNVEEAELLDKGSYQENCELISKSCYVYLKGGHQEDHSNDELYFGGRLIQTYEQAKLYGVEKHGSGCVLSSAIAAGIAKGLDVAKACYDAKEFTKDYLISTDTLLGIQPDTLIA